MRQVDEISGNTDTSSYNYEFTSDSGMFEVTSGSSYDSPEEAESDKEDTVERIEASIEEFEA